MSFQVSEHADQSSVSCSRIKSGGEKVLGGETNKFQSAQVRGLHSCPMVVSDANGSEASPKKCSLLEFGLSLPELVGYPGCFSPCFVAAVWLHDGKEPHTGTK